MPTEKVTLEELAEMRARGLSWTKISKEIGINPRTIQRRMDNAAKRGYLPQMQIKTELPEFLRVKGTSQLIDNRTGEPVMSWVKTTTDHTALETMMRETIEAMAEQLPREKKVGAWLEGSEKLANCYVITDYHMGMLSWHEETGADWDLSIAEQTIVDWFAQAIAQSPAAKTAVFAQLSDFLHFDGMDAVTPASKHLLDVDTRFAKVVRSAIRVLRRVIGMLLAKHERLHIIMADANHDPVSQIWLREWFAVFYEDEPRVTVDRSPSPYNCFEFGKVALFFHHGHKRKVSNVSEVFAAQFREVFGRTKHAYAHLGHLHHIDVKENNLMVVEMHRTLAPADAYAARGGWITGRDAQVITYHCDYGEVSRIRINSDMLK